MIRFECDYAEGAHPRIMENLLKTNLEQNPGYGLDPHCDRAKELIKKECGRDDVDVHLVVGATQANILMCAAMLKPYQGIIAATTGHIAFHEASAIEATGHKVMTVPSDDGKIRAAQIAKEVDWHWAQGNHDNFTQPAAVYISHPTESGTTYTKDELVEISNVCRERGIALFVDGARLGYGVTAPDSTISIADLAQYADAFYIGGTKCGALFGEGLVITNDAFKKDFRYHLKQRGGMLAKGRLLGVQFETLFEDGLYYEITKHANDMAMQIKKALADKGYKFLVESSTNQQFPIMPNEHLEKIGKNFSYSYWQDAEEEGYTVVRFCTSWATTQENVDELVKAIAEL